MSVPSYQSLMLPLLQFAARRGSEVSTRQAADALAQELNLSDADRKEMIPSGAQETLVNRVSWAAFYMKKAGLLEATRRGFYQITERGRELLEQQPKTINLKLLQQYPEFVQFYLTRGAGEAVNSPIEPRPDLTPLEALELAYRELCDKLASELLDKLKRTSPAFFEQIVVELLVKMGYGGSLSDAGKAIGKSGDGGIDGVIKEDKLGLDILYIQAKRWGSNSVGRPDVMQFAGALQAHKASKGIFITTSRFTDDARNYISQIGSKIILIDGTQLTNLMIEYNVGISTVSSYSVKRIDNDYFEENI